ncbi:hypothetical protein O0880_14655 [Janthinobacterium sp. SUN118]|uniref:hypothetical protein n=1 Tax=Janthinobacterium sp. SUN118 TaxID=3004100 RepID=UPI0025B25CF5|nr:hypothetical protein [Janthinobacterium sp. SUN118]MDN2710662.1 hypothetical protein [Janthinobacterium sp. SUN118]
MSARTPGMLMVGETPLDNDGVPETVIGGTGQFENHAIAVAIDFKNAPGMREANARRMVACWNALDGLHDDALGGGWTAAGMNAYAKDLENKLAVARALLSEVVKPHDDHIKAVHASGEKPAVNPLAIRIHDFLKGGAT